MEKEKIVYNNQEEILEQVISFLKLSLKEDIKEAYLFGSVVKKEFGKYIKEYEGHDGSDIDLIVFLTGDKPPKNWKYLNTERAWWKLYRGDGIKINNLIHKIDVLVVNKGQEILAKKSKFFKKGLLRIK